MLYIGAKFYKLKSKIKEINKINYKIIIDSFILLIYCVILKKVKFKNFT